MMFVEGKEHTPCCTTFEEAFHKLAIKKEQGRWLIVLSTNTFGQYELLDEEYNEFSYCPFCGSEVK
jgi:hypothetical protein